jgi:LmbE family N-acetylglucosaminyl deacetylase
VKSGDGGTLADVRDSLSALLDTLRPTSIYAPVGVGGHVDHRLIRDGVLACDRADCELYLYEDFPYAVAGGAVDRWVGELAVPVKASVVDVTDTIEVKIRSIATYASQLPTIFRHYGEWETVTREYAGRIAAQSGAYAERLWQVEVRPPSGR